MLKFGHKQELTNLNLTLDLDQCCFDYFSQSTAVQLLLLGSV